MAPPSSAKGKRGIKFGGGDGGGSNSSSKAAERSAYFARREAARVLRCVLQGDAKRRAVGSIKTLVYGPSVRNKKATFALVCQTLKYLPVLKEVLAAADVLKGKWKRHEELVYVTAYDILFGQATVMVGAVEKFLLLRKNTLQQALAQLCMRGKVKHAEDLLQVNKTQRVSKPRYVRVNTLKLDVHSAIMELEKEYAVKRDSMIANLLVLPPGTDLHNHPLVKNGSIFLQGKASCMAAEALMPESGWKVLDACSAPGNKTVQLAALMRGEGKIIACELHEERVRHLECTVKRSGATNIDVFHGDFLEINPMEPSFSEIRAILLDPSCSGSGTSDERLDFLLPSSIRDHNVDTANSERVKKLAAFQKKALTHALSFPAVERVVYSTCSIFQTENEDVVNSVLPFAFSLGFRLATPFPGWPRRGLPVFQGSEHLIRTDVAEDMEGFFIALFVREINIDRPTQFIACEATGASDAARLSLQKGAENLKSLVRDQKKLVNLNSRSPAQRKGIPYPSPKIHLLSLYMQMIRKRLVKRHAVDNMNKHGNS